MADDTPTPPATPDAKYPFDRWMLCAHADADDQGAHWLSPGEQWRAHTEHAVTNTSAKRRATATIAAHVSAEK